MRRASILAVLSVALLAPAVAQAAPKKGAPPPSCAGKDLLAGMKKSDPEGYAKVRAAADAVPNTKALLWRIEGKGAPTSYLFGTIHSTDARVSKLPPAAAAAFAASSTVALEILTSEAAQSKIEEILDAKGTFNSGDGLKDILKPAELAALRKSLAADGFPAEAAHMMRPWFAIFLLAMPSCEKKRTEAGLVALDQRIEQDAAAQGKRLVALETLASQIEAMVAMPEAAQASILKATVATLALRDDALETLHRAYIARDLATSVPLSKRLVERAGHDPASMDVFERDINTKRNYGMRDASLPLLEKGGAFIAVGALHLLGKEGLVELFRAAGYTVTPAE